MRDRRWSDRGPPRPRGRAPARWLALATMLGVLALSAACSVPFEQSKVRTQQRLVARKGARGAWIVIRYARENPPRALAGELLAAAPDSVHLLTSGGVVAVSISDLEGADLALYEAPSQATWNPVRVVGRPASRQWTALISHARFPQGLPADFDRHAPSAP